MFNWTTTTIINSLSDYTTKLPLVKVWSGKETLEGESLPSGFSGAYPVIKIKRDHTFEGRYISKIYKAIANDPVLCEMTVDCEKIASAVEALVKDNDGLSYSINARLSFYVALEGSEESIYANDWYQKGKPFSIGFEIKSSSTKASDIAESIKKNAEKFGVVTYGKKVFDITIDGNKLVIKGTHEYQRFKMAAITVDDIIDEILVDYFEDGADTKSEGEVFELKKRGLNGFGTSHQLIKDLRVPTAHHNKWLQIKEDEKPVIGAKYNQFIITYCAPSMANPGFTVVGQHNMSVTTHVFWVNQAVSDEFEGYLAEVAVVTPVNEKKDDEIVATEDGVRTAGGENYSANHEQKIVHAESDSDLTKTSTDSKIKTAAAGE